MPGPCCRACHYKAQTCSDKKSLAQCGLDLEAGVIRNNVEAGVLEPAMSKTKMIQVCAGGPGRSTTPSVGGCAARQGLSVSSGTVAVPRHVPRVAVAVAATVAAAAAHLTSATAAAAAAAHDSSSSST